MLVSCVQEDTGISSYTRITLQERFASRSMIRFLSLNYRLKKWQTSCTHTQEFMDGYEKDTEIGECFGWEGVMYAKRENDVIDIVGE